MKNYQWTTIVPLESKELVQLNFMKYHLDDNKCSAHITNGFLCVVDNDFNIYEGKIESDGINHLIRFELEEV